jgi:formylglycine-generating enzyme required for sulfatase activity/predicted Ser/Thr protein kinase
VSDADDRTIQYPQGGDNTSAGGPATSALKRAAVDPMLGRQLGDCDVKAFLGKGGMATVYLGVQRGLEREVAVKVLSPELTKDRKQLEQFFREARTLAKLEHPNIVTVYNVGHEDETHFLVLQLIKGGSLHDSLKTQPIFPPDDARDVIYQIASGLHEAHSQGIVHRDIKPDNVLVAPGPTYKITDFGLAMMGQDGFSQGKVVGTPHYISPEQVDAVEVDTRTDIYSLGATFYHLLTGRPPFKAPSTMDLLIKHVMEPLVPPHEVNPDVPVGISNVVCRMMAKSPDDRYPSTAELLKALKAPEKASQTIQVDAPQPELLLSGQVGPLVLKPIVAKGSNTRGLVAALALVAVSAVMVVLGIGPIKAVLADVREEDATAPGLDISAHVALEQVGREVAGLDTEAAIARYRRLTEDGESPLAAAALTAIANLELQLAAERGEHVKELLETARALRSARKLGEAIDRLSAADAPLLAATGGPEIATELQSVKAQLKELGLAWLPATKAATLGDAGRPRTADIEGFYIQLREVTHGEFASWLKESKTKAPKAWKAKGKRDAPVVRVSYADAKAYAKARAMRLPTGDEWEYAARGSDGLRWPWGDAAEPAHCNWSGSEARGTVREAGSFPADVSPSGCLDMAGNVAEWARGPKGPQVRGGSFMTRQLENTRGAFTSTSAPANGTRRSGSGASRGRFRRRPGAKSEPPHPIPRTPRRRRWHRLL